MVNPGTSSWTIEQEELLEKLWAEGISAEAISRRFARKFTRNAIIGKVHRMGLKKRKKPTRYFGKRNSPGGNAGPRPPAGRTNTSVDKSAPTHHRKARSLTTLSRDPPPFQRIRLTELDYTRCRWPIGNVGDDDFGFCGRRKPADSKPYCPYHADVSTGRIIRHHPAPSARR